MSDQASSKSRWQQLKTSFGFYRDERIDVVQDMAARRMYLVMLILIPPLAAYQQFVNQQPYALWVVLVAFAISLSYLWIQRQQLDGRYDERIKARMNRAFRWAGVMIPVSLLGYFLFLYQWAGGWQRLDQLRGLYLWALAFFISGLATIGTHFYYKTYPKDVWFRAILLGLLLGAILIGFFIWSAP